MRNLLPRVRELLAAVKTSRSQISAVCYCDGPLQMLASCGKLHVTPNIRSI
jgi:hypothetical protein